MASHHTSAEQPENILTKAETRRGLRVLLEFFLLTALLVGSVVVIYTDAVVLQNKMTEKSITEFLHSFLTLSSSVLFLRGAARFPEKKGYLTLVGTLFLIMFVRENDKLLDFLVWHGFWVVPAMAILILGVAQALRHRSTVVEPFFQHFSGRSFTFLYIGLLLLVIFSRLFGTSVIWKGIMLEDYDHVFKTVVQEGLELLGAMLICYGSILSFRNRFS